MTLTGSIQCYIIEDKGKKNREELFMWKNTMEIVSH